MNRVWLVIATGALMALAGNFGIPTANAKERCICTMEAPPVPPAPPIAPVPPVPPVPPPPPPGGYRVHKQVMLLAPDGERVRRVHRIVRVIDLNGNHVVRVIDRDDESNLTRNEFVRRAERAFDERDKNHDGILEDDEREGFAAMEEDDNDDEDVEIPEAPEPPEADDVPEPPEAPAPPPPPRHHR